ncbi:MAG TPA: P-loop NTPase fold protein [Thermoanaerobaculia bacterium]|jgi:hypothetical protein|nr:P-loop NTPase fold protein [Thermoanaerobaculia bacterium]
MFDVLKDLGIGVGENLNFLVYRSAQVHQLRGRAERDPVSRSSMLYAAATIEPLVLAVLETNGLNFVRWERSLGFNSRPPLGAPPQRQPLSFAVSPEAKTALQGYLSISPQRRLDPLGLAAAFLMDPTGPLFEHHLLEAGLHISRAAKRATMFTKFSLNGGAVDPIAAEYAFSDLADSFFRAATQDATERGIAFEPLTTTQVFIAAITSPHAVESTAPWFLRTLINRVLAEGLPNIIDDWMAWYGKTDRKPSRILWSQPLTAIAERAHVLAIDARSGKTVPQTAARHFVGALIASRRWAANCGIPELLAKLRIDPKDLAKDYFSYLETAPVLSSRDDMVVWRRFLGLPEESFVPRFDSEGLGGADQLKITANVNAFASLLASNKIAPPLSIGLFGDWGSGKSFFMARMREEISERARRAASRPNGVFLQRIVQIDFNAWHYVEANLWASLVEHLFRNLKLTHERPDDKVIGERREQLLQKLDSLMAERVAAETALQQAEIDRDETAETLEARKRTADASATVVSGLQGKDVWELVAVDEQTRIDLQNCLSELGAGASLRSNEELRKTFDDLRSQGTRIKLQFAWIFRQPRAIVYLLVLIVLAPFGAAAIVKLLGMVKPQLASISEPVIRFASFASVVTAWLTKRFGSSKATLNRIDAARRSIDEQIETAEKARKDTIAIAEKVLSTAVDNVAEAQAALEKNEKQVANAKQALLELTNGYRLTRFIDERAASDDYRKLLGVLATVRNDFSTLSELMHPARGNSDLSDDLHIDRIILYIDDLDRCRPDRVVEVLQAVHLLLAFKLFVVVVGVDARWVSESLRRKHKSLRGKQSDGDDTPDDGVPGYAVAPHDYLEKIFQVPFWLDPMQSPTTMSYISSLLAEDVARVDKQGIAPDPAGAITAGADGTSVLEGAHSTTVWHTVDEREGADTDPKQLTIDEKEMKYMTTELIARLVMRSPRTAKRYVNTYRFFRASLQSETIDAYLADATPANYRCALMLLAIVVGAPDVSLEVLAQMKKCAAMTTLNFVANALVVGDDYIEQWDAVKAALIGFEEGKCRLAPLIDQIPRVVRYSFRAPYAATTATKTPKPAREKTSKRTPKQKGRPTGRP